MTTINRAPWNALVDDPGNNLEGTPWTKDQIKGVLLDPIDAAFATLDSNINTASGTTIIASADTGTKNDFVLPGRGRDTVWLWSGNADLILNGMAGGALGDRLTIKNQSPNASKIYCPHNAAGSLVANRLTNLATSAPTPLAAGGWATYVWSNGWGLINHDQGSAIAVPFNAANFTASGGAWTLAAANVTTLAYVLRGRTLHVWIALVNTSVAGISQVLVINANAYGGFSLGVSQVSWPLWESNQSVLNEIGYGVISGTYGLTSLALYRPGSQSWPAGTAHCDINPQFVVT